MKKILSAFAGMCLAVTSSSAVSCSTATSIDRQPKSSLDKIDLNKLKKTLTIDSQKDANAFKKELIKKFKEIREFKKLTSNLIKIEIEVDSDSKKEYQEITNMTLGNYGTKKIKISPAEDVENVIGKKIITVVWDPVLVLMDIESEKNVAGFKRAFMTEINQRIAKNSAENEDQSNNENSLSEDDISQEIKEYLDDIKSKLPEGFTVNEDSVEITKRDGTPLDNNYISKQFVIRVSLKSDSSNIDPVFFEIHWTQSNQNKNNNS